MRKVLYVMLALCLCVNSAGALGEAEVAAPTVSAPAQEAATAAPTAAPEVKDVPTAAPTPADDAEAGPTEAPTDEPTEVPTDEPTDEPKDEPTDAPTDTPTDEPTDEPTDAPTAAPTDAPEGDDIPDDAEGWFARDGRRQGGALKDLLPLLGAGDTLYLRAKKPVLVRNVPLKAISGVKLAVDTAALTDGEYAARAFEQDPTAADDPAWVTLADYQDADDDAAADLYFWAMPLPDESDKDTPTPPPGDGTPALTVTAEGLTPGAWQREAPTFALSGIPEGKRWTYAAIIYDERIIPLSGDSYTPEAEGVYTLRFAMMDEIGDIVDASEKYTLWLDATAPESLQAMADDAKDYTLTVTASDAMSGVTGLSLDGGESWIDLSDGETYVYTAAGKETFAAGQIQVRDAAGNVAQWPESVTLDKVYRGGGGGYTPPADGQSTPAKTHASGDGEDPGAYEALHLQFPEAPMRQLTIDGEAMPLTLVLEAADAGDDQVGGEVAFTASVQRWTAEDAAEGEEDAADTLVLTAEPDDALGEQFTYAWHFNGEVYRQLAASGIKYMALRVGEDLVAFPTEGFTGGTKYTELKMLGVSTRRFDYTITMRVNRDPGYISALSDSDFSRQCDISIRAEVENMAYELGGSAQSLMYYYDVYLGPEDMLNQPFGTYAANDH